MKWDMPIRPIESGPLTRREIKELDGFLLAEDLKNPMDFFTFDGFICAVLSGPNTIMPSQWLRWVWDQEEGEQPPAFTSEKQAKRILSLLIGHANVVAFTLTHGPQHYEPRFYAHKIEGNSVPIIDEWCCGYRHYGHTNLFRITSSIRADMISGRTGNSNLGPTFGTRESSFRKRQEEYQRDHRGRR
jgi:Uncharacterised protein family (UPF0149)